MSGPLPVVRSIGLPRLTAGFELAERLDRVAHLSVHGPLPSLSESLLTALAGQIDLRGRGGAAFPFARKLRAVADAARRRGDRTCVVVNGCEGEPACRKDAVLLARAPHLVLDGALLAVDALDARQLVIGVTQESVERSVREALAERGLGERRGRPLRARVVRLPERFVSGEASALIRAADGGPPLPPGRRTHASDAGVGGLPTLLSNTETFAQLAVAARLGAGRFAATGIAAEPGTVLLTVSGSVPAPALVETPTGVPLSYVLQLCGAGVGQGVLVGGYHGGWMDPVAASLAAVSRESMTAHSATLGAGAMLPLAPGTCPLGETLRVAQWLAAESSGQCGPCRLGLPALAGALSDVLGGGGQGALEAVRRSAHAVRGRGACRHPDGASRFLLSGVSAFTDDLAAHVLGGGCGRPTTGELPLPDEERGARLAVDWTLCQGHGLCAGLLPELVRLDGDGYPSLAGTPVPGHLRAAAVRALRRCPALALRLE
ncbi:NADH-ubiquinone oxidoreductase-F iron-sulfur binding region domain-containing protein [Streptomyces sp. H10-C2]|nr:MULTISPECIES: NADH-quinone oxidoreductase subunit NuoF family protein [unclassified Streptomyces]MDJ0340169.1 NADH-ubiquinone oxidoreductase-F iron-sulfur binding region domain-containing protein [Streptomyces sp. PH10-H1]MDJ0369194.1 NADH-ubiquinone oxidoreductase-F iron-sulfur binding region domain-containing protein [Streptomyces sp. H10-C2]